MTDSPSAARRGRPRQGNDLKSYALPCRTSLRLRKRVEEAARGNNRSLAQEIEANTTNGFIDFEGDDNIIFDIHASASSGSVEGLDHYLSKQKNKKGLPSFAAALSVGNGRIEIE